MSKVTEMVQSWHDDGEDNAHAIYYVAEEIADLTFDEYDLKPTKEQAVRLKMVYDEIIGASVDWDKIAQDDENARGWEDAKRSALYK